MAAGVRAVREPASCDEAAQGPAGGGVGAGEGLGVSGVTAEHLLLLGVALLVLAWILRDDRGKGR